MDNPDHRVLFSYLFLIKHLKFKRIKIVKELKKTYFLNFLPLFKSQYIKIYSGAVNLLYLLFVVLNTSGY